MARVLRWVAALTTFALLVGGGFAAYHYGWLEEWVGDRTGSQSAAALKPWQRPVPAPALPAQTGLDAVADPALVQAALAEPLASSAFGGRIKLEVATTSGQSLMSRGNGVATPASTLKLVTGLGVLRSYGADHRFATSVVQPRAGAVVLVGGGDPSLRAEAEPNADASGTASVDATGAAAGSDEAAAAIEPATLAALAKTTAAQLKAAGQTTVRVGFDDTLFTGPRTHPTWPDSYVTGSVVSPVGALRINSGILADNSRDRTPGQTATQVFAEQLRAQGITVKGKVKARTGLALVGSESELARVDGEPVDVLVQRMLEFSDNDIAETLFHLVGSRVGDGTFAGGAAELTAVLQAEGIELGRSEILDGSGLSRQNLLAPRMLTRVLQLSLTEPDLQVLNYGLPVAGFSGSLKQRFEVDASEPGLGVVRAKTGTLTGVSGLAGFVTTRDGVDLTFVLLADRVLDTIAAREALDSASAALAECLCAQAGPAQSAPNDGGSGASAPAMTPQEESEPSANVSP